MKLAPLSAEILICVSGTVLLLEDGAYGQEPVELTRGTSAFVAAGVGSYIIEGRGRLYRAAIGYEDMG